MRTALAVALLTVLTVSVLAQETPSRIRVGGAVQQSLALSRPAPIYPPLAKQARIQGVVRLDATISKDGLVQDLKVISGHPLLAPAAIDAVRQWQYKPTFLNGQPVEVITTIDVNFTLAGEGGDAAMGRTLLDEGAGWSAQQVFTVGSDLTARPDELFNRIRLLGYYAAAMKRGATDVSHAAVERRQQVLWLIQNHPESGALFYPEGQLVPGRHRLADADGYPEAKSLWLDQAAHSTDIRVIANAVRFLEIRDREDAERVLLAVQPQSPQVTSMLGRVYALAMAGLSPESLDGPPVFDSRDRLSAFAQRAHAALDSSSDTSMLLGAERTLMQLGKGDVQLEAFRHRIEQRLQWLSNR